MLKQLFKFEAKYQSKQLALPIFAFIFLLYGLILSRQGYVQANINFNAPHQIFHYTGIMTLGCVFIVMFFSVTGILRDSRYKMEHLIYSNRIKKLDYFISRFVGVLVFSILAFTAFLIGFAVGPLFSGVDQERLATFKMMSYLWPLLILAIPNIFVCASIIFSISILSKSNVATYVGAVMLYAFYFLSAAYFNSPLMANSVPASPESMTIAALVDPFALSAFFEQTQNWTAYQKNTQLLSFSGFFMWNRIFWTLLSILLMAITYHMFSFRKLNQKVKKEALIKGASQKPKEVSLKYEPMTTNWIASQWKSFKSLLKIELTGVFRSLPFVAIISFWLIVVFMELYSRIYQGGAYGDSWYPFTNILIELFTDPLPAFSIILIVLYSGELIWRERGFNLNGIMDSLPISNALFYSSKLAALVLLPILLITSGVLMSMAFQIASGYYDFEIGQYLSLYYYSGMALLFYSFLAMFVQSLVPNKYLGMGIAGMLIFVFSIFASRIGIEHPLLQLGRIVSPGYSNMSGYAGGTKLFNHLTIYWLSFGGILSIISIKMWHRGALTQVASRIKLLFYKWNKKDLYVVAFLGVIFICTGGTIFYNQNIANEYTTSADYLDFREDYERKFKKYEDLEGLFPVKMKTEVDLYPNEGKYHVRANYILKNKTGQSMDRIFITRREPFNSIAFENARIVEYDSIYGTYVFRFEEKLQPGDEITMTFDLIRESKGYETDQTIVGNGTYIMHRDFDPILGYRNSMEISDAFERKKRELPELIEESNSDTHLQTAQLGFGRVEYETVISTISDQTALGTGDLLDQWIENGRNFYHYKSSKPIVPSVGYFSARYETKNGNYKEIEIDQFYKKGHDYNVENIEYCTKFALKYCADNFGNYPFDNIRIAEIPAHWGFGGFAHPGLISMVEDNLYLVDNRDTMVFDLVAKRTIHEVAHQWWGHTLIPKMVAGGSLLVEGFAKYSEAVIMEKMFGKKAIWQLSDNANGRYFRGRAFDGILEPPLYLVDGQGYISYGKSYTVMLALRDLMGEDIVNKVLRILVDRHRDTIEFHATSLEFLEEIYKVASEDQIVLIDDWFKRVITYDLSVEEVSKEELENGQLKINVSINAERFKTLDSGMQEAIGINESIKIGVFATHPSNAIESHILHLESYLVNDNQVEIEIILDAIEGQLPQYISIDPYGTRSDANYVNNTRRI